MYLYMCMCVYEFVVCLLLVYVCACLCLCVYACAPVHGCLRVRACVYRGSPALKVGDLSSFPEARAVTMFLHSRSVIPRTDPRLGRSMGGGRRRKGEQGECECCVCGYVRLCS
eukprot:GHVS01056037.1.p1 GENE.GHVS01056037.1~~GHVS01056037.1.p1  ORF type:complete len:113 (+),score=11.42 GHVS01056037.1:646-984(+)